MAKKNSMKGEIFRQVQSNRRLGWNAFNNSNSYRTSFNMGELIPTMRLNCVPGDRHIYRHQNMLRALALASPAYVNLKVTQDTFFVPYRILWPKFEKFITGELEVVPPYGDNLQSCQKGDLGDYLTLPTDVAAGITERFCAFYTAAYYLIYDEWYRNQKVVDEKYTELVDGPNSWINTATYNPPLKIGWMKDYFTACLPEPQEGSPVTLPLLNDDEALVKAYQYPDDQNPIIKSSANGNPVPGQPTYLKAVNNPASGSLNYDNESGSSGAAYIDPNGAWYVDINNEAVLISEVRRAVMLQEFLELLNRVGTRYTEFVQGVFNTFTGDARLNRPEFISRHTASFQISEVLSTAETTGVPVGDLKGHAISVSGSKKVSYRCKEHGVLMTLTCVRPTTSYHQGLHRDFSRDTWLDYFIPHFENIGEQAVYNKEIFLGAGMDDTKANTVFGYNVRNAEYKFQNDYCTGEMRDDLLFWNLSRDFAAEPGLNETFITCDPDHRIFADTDPSNHKIVGHIYNDVVSLRPMQKYSSPTL